MDMENYSSSYKGAEVVDSRTFLNQVFIWMGTGLAVTALVAYLFAFTPSLMTLLITEAGRLSILGYVVMFAPLGFVMLMSFAFNRLSYTALVGLFMAYSAIMGASLSFIFLRYTTSSIYSTFITSALMFGGMGLFGYITKSDLTKVGSILIMAVWGIIIASVINLLLIKSGPFAMIISMITVVVFCGLTAYDVQKLKNLSETTGVDAYNKNKLGIMGALTLYLDFINIFLSMLRLFGSRRD
jgi:uncharacterized protein